MKAYVFPGQGSQFPGMGRDLFDRFEIAKEIFQASDEILGFDLSKILLEGTKEDLLQTRVTQPANFDMAFSRPASVVKSSSFVSRTSSHPRVCLAFVQRALF